MFQYFIAMGFGHDRRNWKMMDITVCYLQQSKLSPYLIWANVTVDHFFADTTVMLEHYYLEDKMAGVLYPHKAQVNMLTWDIDTETGMVWCNFSR